MIGASGFGQFWHGEIAELTMYGKAMTSQEAAAVTDCLTAHYGL